jgi:glycosyltransferase involved in cell wall biosynthesis
LIFTGGDKGNLEHVKRVAKGLGLSARVEFKGFVEPSELAGLMKDAKCVVFPSQLGPSNLPPMEAALLGTKSLISNVHFDPLLSHPLINIVPTQSAEDWAMAMLQSLKEVEIPLEPLSDIDSTLITQLSESFLEFKARRNEWMDISHQRFQRK